MQSFDKIKKQARLSIWLGSDRIIRIGHSGDVVQMLDDMKLNSIGYKTVSTNHYD